VSVSWRHSHLFLARSSGDFVCKHGAPYPFKMLMDACFKEVDSIASAGCFRHFVMRRPANHLGEGAVAAVATGAHSPCSSSPFLLLPMRRCRPALDAPVGRLPEEGQLQQARTAAACSSPPFAVFSPGSAHKSTAIR